MTVLLVAVELEAVAAVGLGQRGKQALCEDAVHKYEQKSGGNCHAMSVLMLAQDLVKQEYARCQSRTFSSAIAVRGAGLRVSVTKGQRTIQLRRWHATTKSVREETARRTGKTETPGPVRTENAPPRLSHRTSSQKNHSNQASMSKEEEDVDVEDEVAAAPVSKESKQMGAMNAAQDDEKEVSASFDASAVRLHFEYRSMSTRNVLSSDPTLFILTIARPSRPLSKIMRRQRQPKRHARRSLPPSRSTPPTRPRLPPSSRYTLNCRAVCFHWQPCLDVTFRRWCRIVIFVCPRMLTMNCIAR